MAVRYYPLYIFVGTTAFVFCIPMSTPMLCAEPKHNETAHVVSDANGEVSIDTVSKTIVGSTGGNTVALTGVEVRTFVGDVVAHTEV